MEDEWVRDEWNSGRLPVISQNKLDSMINSYKLQTPKSFFTSDEFKEGYMMNTGPP